MSHVKTLLVLAGLFILFFNGVVFSSPSSFDQAKVLSKESVYFDRNLIGTFYCGCEWEWVGRSGGRIDFDSCGYEVRAQQVRAERLEWEHVVPASNFGRARQCWQDGGRSNCLANDPIFRLMEADMHNLTPSVGEVNADRSNYNFGVLPSTQYQHGSCPIKIDFAQRTAEPSRSVKGKVARIYFYMHDRYDLRMSRQQQQLLMAWDSEIPVTEWERVRDSRIAQIMGHSNPFVTGERKWKINHKNTADGFVEDRKDTSDDGLAIDEARIRGNIRSKVYHLPQGCPSYDLISERNIHELQSENDAVEEGFRKAGNCR